MQEVRLERLLGRRVFGPDGRPVGRIEEVRAEKDGADLVVTEYLMGPGALRERLAARLGRGAKGYAASWNQLDLSDPDRPCLNCSAEELRKLGASRRRHRRQR